MHVLINTNRLCCSLLLAVFFIAISVGIAFASNNYSVCSNEDLISLTEPVEFTAAELNQFKSLPTLRVLAGDGPPMAAYNQNINTYTGIGPDVLCFIAERLGVQYHIVPGRDQTIASKINQVQNQEADIFMFLSHTPERAKKGVFTNHYYESYYAVIGKKGSQLLINNLNDLAKYNVGVISGVAFDSILRDVVPPSHLQFFNLTDSDGLFKALRDGKTDAVVFSKDIFLEKRYNHEYFDLEVVHTLYEHPRLYGFYLSKTKTNEKLVNAFNKYLAVMDLSKLIAMHTDGEQKLIERYIKQRSQRGALQIAVVVAALMALGFYVAVHRYRRLSSKLAEQNHTDDLTGLSNRRHFDRVLASKVLRHRRSGTPLSLMVIDVDDFKAINDNYGHMAGDKYLRSIAIVIKNNLKRVGDLAARYGGDEFICLLPDTSAQNAVLVANQISTEIAGLELPNEIAAVPKVTISIGVATLVKSNVGASVLMAEADAQLYKAKLAGRNHIMNTTISSKV